MMYLLWALINIGLFLFFIAVSFKATILLREKLGLFASVIFVFGLLSFIGHSSNDNENKESNSTQIKTWEFANGDSLKINGTDFLHIDLEKTLFSKYELRLKYGKDKERNLVIPISAYSSNSGFISGTNWKPFSININATNDKNKFEYMVLGIVEWKILGIAFYFEPKDYTGFLVTK
ncbi:hypothetical protein [Lacihabitans lacunae]|uniref:Uncharacterized protein n=1 Tax=Lacihabitans lacunae TaxID=1028214 RepID=A0ABV7YZK6_9BACT